MTVNRGPGVAPIAGVGTTTVEHRLQLAGLYAENAPGVPRSGVLAQATDQLVVARADWSYDIGPAPFVINRTASEGVYTPTLTGTTNVTTDAAPATNSRWDLVYIKQNDQAKGDVDNAAIVGVQKGVADASPTKPTADLPAGAYVIAEARIFAGTTGTSGGSNTVTQVWRHTAARAAPIPVRNTTERGEITAPANGQQVVRIDVAGRPAETWDGTVWRPATGNLPFGHMGRTAGNFAINATASTVPMDAAQALRGGVTFDNATDSLVIPVTGLYRVTVKLYTTGGATGKHSCSVSKVGSGGATIPGCAVQVNKSDGTDWFGDTTVTTQLTAGDKLYLAAASTSASNTWGTNGYDGTFLEVLYIGA